MVKQERPKSNGRKTGVKLVTDQADKGKAMDNRADSENAIGAGLRSLYQGVVKEPLPDDMLALLEKLGSSDASDK